MIRPIVVVVLVQISYTVTVDDRIAMVTQYFVCEYSMQDHWIVNATVGLFVP